jgi:hypothetical protein
LGLGRGGGGGTPSPPPPPPPVLFNLVVDALATLLERAKLVVLIKGLVPDLIEGGLTHL